MKRRAFIRQAGAALAGAVLSAATRERAQTAADVNLEIAPLALEIAPRKIIHTVAYNGQVPGPLIRWPEGKPIAIDVLNRTSIPEIVHWHGLAISSEMDGSAEEGGSMIAPGARFRYRFTPKPAGFRWYHTHAFAGHDLKRGTYSGQFGCFYIEPRNDAGAYDQEIFLTLHDWNAYMGASGDSSMEAAYEYATINGRMLGFGDPLRVREGQRLLLHVLNASASLVHWLALSGHQMTVVAMDGNPVPEPRSDARDSPGAGRACRCSSCDEPARVPGFREKPVTLSAKWAWASWSSMPTSKASRPGSSRRKRSGTIGLLRESRPLPGEPDEIMPLRFESKFHGQGAFDSWTINGKSFPHTDTVMLRQGKRYRLRMTNHSSDDHPLHLHRHTFEVTSLDGKPLSGLNKDVVIVPANTVAEVDFTADNPGATLFHCHNQTHMDFGFMMLFQYA